MSILENGNQKAGALPEIRFSFCAKDVQMTVAWPFQYAKSLRA